MGISTISDPALPEFAQNPLLVLLPGADMSAEDFRTHGFFAAVRRRGQPIDMIAAETGMDCYLDDRVVALLHDEIIEPAWRRGRTRIWLAGISLGGMGALLYAAAHPDRIEGVILISPFIATRGLIAQAENAGGLRRWQPTGANDSVPERRLLAWLSQYDPADRRWPRMRLAYGIDDRFASAYRLLAEILPEPQILRLRGGHDWPTWTALWQELLGAAPFAAPASTEGSRVERE